MYKKTVTTKSEDGKMSLFSIGRLCMKIAGRDAGLTCVVVEEFDNNYVLVDGITRRKKVNVKHLEPLDKVIELSKGASHEDVKSALLKEGIEVKDTKPKNVEKRPRKLRKVKTKKSGDKKSEKKSEKKSVKKEEKVEKKEEKPVPKKEETKTEEKPTEEKSEIKEESKEESKESN
jgi:large subunit ribosomal protein L14e